MGILPGKHVISERPDAKHVGYWMHQVQEERNQVYRDLRIAYDAALATASHFGEHLQRLKSNGNLTEKGVREAARKEGLEAVERIARNKMQATAALRRDIAARMATMKEVPVDRADVVGEMQRRELREHFNSLSAAQRERAIDTADDAMLDALLSAPAVLVKADPSMLEVAAAKRMEKRFGPEMAILNDLQQAVETVERAYDAARDEIRHGLGLQSHEFETIAAEVEGPAIEQERSKVEKLPVNERPVVDTDKLAAEILALPYADRSRMLDIALDIQGKAA